MWQQYFIHISWTGHVTETHTHTHTRAYGYTLVIISSTVTGETFRGKERGALNNECPDPCYRADEPLKSHNLLPRLWWHRWWGGWKDGAEGELREWVQGGTKDGWKQLQLQYSITGLLRAAHIWATCSAGTWLQYKCLFYFGDWRISAREIWRESLVRTVDCM